MVIFYVNQVSSDIKTTTNHFNEGGKHAYTIKRIVRRYLESNNVKRKNGAGHKAIIMTQKVRCCIKKRANNQNDIVASEIAQKLNCSQPYVSKVIFKKLKAKFYFKKNSPKYI